MFGGTGAFRNHLCPHLKNPSKNSTTSSPPTCIRPHCKYNHSVGAFSEQPQNGISSSPPPVNKRSSFSAGSGLVAEASSGLSRSISSDEVVRGVDDHISEVSPVHNGITSALPNLEESILALQKSGIASLLTKPGNGELPHRPTYSDTPSQALNNHNPYTSVWDEPSKPPQTNDLEYDPVNNWKIPFRSSAPPPSEAPPSYDPSPLPPPSSPPSEPSSSSSATIRNRLANENSQVTALGKKPVVNGLKSGVNIGIQKKRPLPSPVNDVAKGGKKKARLGKASEEEDMPEEPAVVVKKERVLNEAEVMKNLFGDSDEDDVDEVVELPIEMPAAKSVPKGFPKNTQKLLQSMTVEPSKPSRPVDPAPPRPAAPPKKKVLTPQQQLEMRNKALEEARSKQHSTVLPSTSQPVVTSSTSTAVPVAAVDKGAKRMAHQPAVQPGVDEKGAVIPRVSNVPGSKLSMQFRQQVLENFVKHTKEIYKDEKEAVEKAVQKEREIAVNSFHAVMYRNKATQELVRLKQAATPLPPVAVGVVTGQKDKPITFPKTTQATPPAVQKQNYSVLARPAQQRAILNDPKMWSEEDFYKAMKKYVLTEDHLVINGYPLIQGKKQDGEKKRDGLQLYIAMSGKITPDRITQTHRKCCRCTKDFIVDFEGNYSRDEECYYHWGKAFSRRVSGEGIAARRNCCSDESSSRGCCVAKCHVTDTIPSLSGFVSTQGVRPVKPEDRFRVYAIDCEMIYTIGGIELARVTVVDRSLQVIYESLIKPKQRIVDCNTRFSGLKPEMFAKETGKGFKTIEEVHKELLGGLINEETILVGHSLESDLLAMKIIHRNIVDTSIVFPHKRGPPFKRALRNLMRELLQKIIQEDVGGHDSREDAAACMELMIWKMKQDKARP